jgi:hypothetical protein
MKAFFFRAVHTMPLKTEKRLDMDDIAKLARCELRSYLAILPASLWPFSPQANYTDRATAACRRS